jgi:hypothetical protein
MRPRSQRIVLLLAGSLLCCGVPQIAVELVIAPGETPFSNVRTVRLRFMNASREWVDRWPVSDGIGFAGSERLRPAAIEITLDLEDWGEIRRVVEVAG